MTRASYIVLSLTGLLAGTALSACTQPAVTAPYTVTIENITVIDSANGARANMDVNLNDGVIASVTPHQKNRRDIGADITRINGTGKFMIPGLWDAHVHLAYDPNLNHETFFPLSIAHGVTSLRDTGGQLDLLAPSISAAKANPKSPDLYISGPLIDGRPAVYDGTAPGLPNLAVSADTPEEAENIVDDLAAANVDFVKAYEMLKPEVFGALTKRAQTHNLPIALHIPLSMTVEDAIAAGANDMQHLRNLELSCTSETQRLLMQRREMLDAHDGPAGKLRSQMHSQQRALALPAQDEGACDAVIKSLADNKVIQTPTLALSRTFLRSKFGDADYPKSFEYLPAKIGDAWAIRSAAVLGRTPSEASQAYDEWITDIMPRLRDAGVPIMAGTDAPIGFLTPGASLHQELYMLVEAGLTPLEAIDSATRVPATFLNLQKERGQIEDGMKADLVLLEANPLSDIRNIARISAVIKNGHVIDRAGLDDLLAAPRKQD